MAKTSVIQTIIITVECAHSRLIESGGAFPTEDIINDVKQKIGLEVGDQWVENTLLAHGFTKNDGVWNLT